MIGGSGRRQEILNWLAPLALLVAIGLIWEAWVRITDKPVWFLPAPSRIIETMWDDRRLLFEQGWVTLQEIVLGFMAAIVIGVVVAVAIHASGLIERTVYPVVVASQAIPVVALAPLLLIWFGHGMAPKVIMTALISFFPIVVATTDGLDNSDRETLEMLKTMGASGWQRFRYVSAPGALPSFFSGAKVGVAVAVIGAVIGEFVGSNSGLGHTIILANASLRTDLVFACVAVLAVMGVGLFAIVSWVEKVALPWRRFQVVERR